MSDLEKTQELPAPGAWSVQTNTLSAVDPYSLAAAEVVAEVRRAIAMWPTFASAHEGFAILDEERDELWAEVKVNQKRRDLAKMRKEAIQVAAMALRFAVEVTDEVNGRR